jgi:hypothetical protein
MVNGKKNTTAKSICILAGHKLKSLGLSGMLDTVSGRTVNQAKEKSSQV